MLIGLSADFLYCRITFRAIGPVSETVRTVELSWEEASELSAALSKMLGDHSVHSYEQQNDRELEPKKR